MLPFTKKVSYSMGRFGSSLLLTLVDLAGLNIYYFYFALDAFRAGIAFAIGYIVIGLSHYLIGFLSDATKSRFGRRKPYIMIGAPLLAITGFLIFVPNWFIQPSPDPRNDLIFQNLMFTYNVIFLSLFKFAYAFLLTAYQAWLPEITTPEERPTVAAMQNNANWMGDGAAIIIAFLTSVLFVGGVLTEFGFILLASFCILLILLYLPSILFIREREITIPKRSIKRETLIVLRNSNYVKWLFVVGFWSFTTGTITSIMIPMVEHGLQLGTIELVILALIFLVSIIVMLYVWGVLARRYGKRRVLNFALLFLAILLPFTFILGLPGLIPVMVQTAIFAIPLGCCIAALFLMRYIAVADMARVDEIQTGESRAGMYEGFQGIPLNTFQAFGVFFLGWLLKIGEVTPGVEYPNYMLFHWGPIYAPFLVIAIIILMFVDIDPNFKVLEEQLAK